MLPSRLRGNALRLRAAAAAYHLRDCPAVVQPRKIKRIAAEMQELVGLGGGQTIGLNR